MTALEEIQKENDVQRARISMLLSDLERKQQTGQGINPDMAFIQMLQIGERIGDLYEASLMLTTGEQLDA